MMLDKYIDIALSEENRGDNEINAKYILSIRMAEVGIEEKGNFWCEVKIPRQTNNSLGLSLQKEFYQKDEVISFLKQLINKLKSRK